MAPCRAGASTPGMARLFPDGPRSRTVVMRRVLVTTLGSRLACETPRKHPRLVAVAGVALWLGAGGQPLVAHPAHLELAAPGARPSAFGRQGISAPDFHDGPPAPTEQTGSGRSRGVEEPVEEQSRGIIDAVARLLNFTLLAGTLWYLLRGPLRNYLNDRSAAIRGDLAEAAEMRCGASEQMAEIDRRMEALPGELEALRAQGAAEIAAEVKRIHAAAEAERDRLLEQARREIELQVKVAERDLVSHAADLAVGVASERLRASITDEDQERLVDRYVAQLKGSSATLSG